MKIIYHKADSRGNADHGWLHSRHTFSFANYFDPERMNFGALRVFNDDRVAGGMGFGTHPHKNMEIISIPLEGDLVHRDSMGNETVIKNGDIQIMSAGTGVQHSEKNKNQHIEVKFLQIWVLPKLMDIEPRYDQIQLNPEDRKNTLQQIVAPGDSDSGVQINQDAWFHLLDLEAGRSLEYEFKKEGNGVYIFVLEGNIEAAEQVLHKRDGLGISETERFQLKAKNNSQLLLMEVPML